MIDPNQPDYENLPHGEARPAYHYRLRGPTAAPVVSIVSPFFNTGEVFHETATIVTLTSGIKLVYCTVPRLDVYKPKPKSWGLD